MPPWEWVVFGLVLLALAQLIALYYVRRFNSKEDGSDPARPAPEPSFDGGSEMGREPPEEDGSAVQCPHCGIENDPEYSFCRECVSPIA